MDWRNPLVQIASPALRHDSQELFRVSSVRMVSGPIKDNFRRFVEIIPSTWW